MLHRVSPEKVRAFEPNRILRITPEFLAEVIVATRSAGFDICAMDEVPERLSTSEGRPFACFTFDDGYRDNLEHALPVLQRLAVPATVYVPSGFPSGGADLWWITLEHAIRACDSVEVRINGEQLQYETATTAGKTQCFDQIYWKLRCLREDEARRIVARLADRAGVDPAAIARRLIMNWDEVRQLAADPLITIGAHTVGHYALAKLPDGECEREMRESIRGLEEALDFRCRHFAYPYGDEESAGPREFEIAARLGMRTAVTTRKGLIHAGQRDSLYAMPRLSLNGDFQDMRYVDVLMSGAPFALWNSLSACRRIGRRAACQPWLHGTAGALINECSIV
jgi:peptidoglycan/xylan/chitin deacetylase (PgdA/CDA1 family)